jgi:DNA-binding Lrp family transcriptional regulator
MAMPLSYVLMNVQTGSEEKVLGEVRKVPNVKECHRVYGVYDLIAKVEADSMDGLKEIVTWKIRRLDGVSSTLTAIVME